MIDVVDRPTRSKMMSGIRSKNTTPELAVRRYLHANGFRFRIHKKGLAGKPDLVLKKYRLVIFVHGCFWHRHPDCVYSTSPQSRKDFWQDKFKKNVERDNTHILNLLSENWRVLTVWECGLKHLAESTHEIIEKVISCDILMVWPETPPRKM